MLTFLDIFSLFLLLSSSDKHDIPLRENQILEVCGANDVPFRFGFKNIYTSLYIYRKYIWKKYFNNFCLILRLFKLVKKKKEKDYHIE